MRIARRTMVQVLACAAGALLAGADGVPAVPTMPALREAAPVLEGWAATPEPAGAIVPSTFPLAPAQLPETPYLPRHHEPVRPAVGPSEEPALPGMAGSARLLAAAGVGEGTMRRLVFVVGPRVWAPSVDLGQPYLNWPDVQADGARARLASDPTSVWSTLEAFRVRVPLRDSAAPYVRFSVPVPVEPGATIQSVRPAPDEPLPPRPWEVLGARRGQP